MSKILIALGGNALGENYLEQQRLVKHAAQSIVKLIAKGHQVVITHGNGPQVGIIHQSLISQDMPLTECAAMSQGYIGYHLQQALDNELKAQKINKQAVSLVCQVVVDKEDQAFNHPTKPIGNFVNQKQAQALTKEFGYDMQEDANRGYRRFVASPQPKSVVEKAAIMQLIDNDFVVIASGGGGIPVIETANGLKGIEAVIDKDASAAMMADLIDIDILLILTAVDYVMLNYGLENQVTLKQLNLEQIDTYIAQKHFHKGSMLPKIEAAKRFVASNESRICYITSLESALDAISNKVGTKITKR